MGYERITALGGSGENGRNCYLMETGEGTVLLDCGVKREGVGAQIGAYPAITREIAARLDAVILSHAHEDHCAALPLLYALGYTGAVYATAETAAAAPRMMAKWMRYVASRGGATPFDATDAARVRFMPLALGENAVAGLRVLAGRSGHTVGGVWTALSAGQKTLFYSGDMCLCSPLLAVDVPPRCDAAVLNCAYAGQVLDQRAQYAALLARVRETLARGGKVLLPLPATGRGCDLLAFFAREVQNAPVYAEEAIVEGCRAALASRVWLREGAPRHIPAVHVVRTQAEREAACAAKTGVYLTPDGMLTTETGLYYAKRFARDPQNRVLITGHAAPGTPGAALLAAGEQKDRMAAQRVTIKVHLDERDAQALCETLGAKNVALFHANAARCETLLRTLRGHGVAARCLSPGEGMAL